MRKVPANGNSALRADHGGRYLCGGNEGTALENLDYLVYRHLPKGLLHNLIFRLHTGSRRVVGNYNCYEKDKDTYGLMLEAVLHRMNELLSEPENEE